MCLNSKRHFYSAVLLILNCTHNVCLPLPSFTHKHTQHTHTPTCVPPPPPYGVAPCNVLLVWSVHCCCRLVLYVYYNLYFKYYSTFLIERFICVYGKGLIFYFYKITLSKLSPLNSAQFHSNNLFCTKLFDQLHYQNILDPATVLTPK